MKKNGDEIDLNFIEEAAREMGGRDEASLLRQMEEAQREWEREKQEHPEEAAAVERAANQQFAAIMARLKAENIQPVSREEYERRKREEEREKEQAMSALTSEEPFAAEDAGEEKKNEKVVVARKNKKRRKVVVIAAIAAVLMVGTGVVAIGKPRYQVIYLGNMAEKNVQITYNTDIYYSESRLEEAYKEIQDSLKIPVIVFDYLPDEWIFDRVIITDREGVLKFSCGDQWLYLKAKKYPIDDNLNSLISDRKSNEIIHNDWLNADLLLEKNVLDDNTIEYSVVYGIEEVTYYLSAIVEKSVFVEIAENLILVK